MRRVLENIICPIRLHNICLGLEQPLNLFVKRLLMPQEPPCILCVCNFRPYACIVNVFLYVKLKWQQVNFRCLKTAWPSNSQVAVWFTFCTTLELFRHRWKDVLQPSQIHRHKIPSFPVHFRCFATPRQKSSEKAPCARKRLTPSCYWLKLMTSKTFTKWEVCTFRIGASRCGASYDRFRERNVTFFSLSTSGVWKQVDPRIHR